MNEVVPNLPYYDLVMQMEQRMESQDLIDSQFKQLHHQRTFDIDCSYTPNPNFQYTCKQSSAYRTQAVGKFISYRGSHDDTYSSIDFSGDNVMVYHSFQNGEMLSRSVPALEEMACLENLSCDKLDRKESLLPFRFHQWLYKLGSPMKVRKGEVYYTSVLVMSVHTQSTKLSLKRYALLVKQDKIKDSSRRKILPKISKRDLYL